MIFNKYKRYSIFRSMLGDLLGEKIDNDVKNISGHPVVHPQHSFAANKLKSFCRLNLNV
jgi:hypothetical protein